MRLEEILKGLLYLLTGPVYDLCDIAVKRISVPTSGRPNNFVVREHVCF